MTNDLPSVGTEDARRMSEADLADLMALHKFTSEGVWAQGQTSHHTVSKREGRDDYRIAEFHHAADASFVDVAHKYMPLLIGEVTDLRRERDELASRVRELTRQNEAQKDEWLSWNEKRAALEANARRYEWLRDKSEPGICAFYLSVGKAFDGVKFKRETVDEAIDDKIEAGRHTASKEQP